MLIKVPLAIDPLLPIGCIEDIIRKLRTAGLNVNMGSIRFGNTMYIDAVYDNSEINCVRDVIDPIQGVRIDTFAMGN